MLEPPPNIRSREKEGGPASLEFKYVVIKSTVKIMLRNRIILMTMSS